MSDFLPTDYESIDENSANLRLRSAVKKKLAVLMVVTITVTSRAAVLSGRNIPTTSQMDHQQLLLLQLQKSCTAACNYCFADGPAWLCNVTQNRACKDGCALYGISASDSYNDA